MGSYVAMVFRVAGYTDEVGGTALVQLEHVDRFGERAQLDLFSDSHVVLDGPEELYDLVPVNGPDPAPPARFVRD